MTWYLAIFVAGFAGSFHCVGMCGGFACALGRDARGRGATMLRHLVYNSGRLASYCFLGGMAGALGQIICTAEGVAAPVTGGSFAVAQRILAVAAGLLMILFALQLFGLLSRLHRLTAGFSGSTFAATLRSLLAGRSHATALAFGVFNGFLPCPLVYAFAAEAASTATAPSGAAVMAAFGLGTFPAMLAVGGVGRFLAPAWRLRGVRIAGGCILLLGLITLGRGVLPSLMPISHAWRSAGLP